MAQRLAQRFMCSMAVVLFGTLLSTRCAYGEPSAFVREVLRDQPVGYWRFENSKDDAQNAKPKTEPPRSTFRIVNPKSVTLVDGVPGIGGQSLRFNGSSGYVEISHDKSLESNTLTVEFWFRTQQKFDDTFWPGSATFVSKATPGAGSSDWAINAASPRRSSDQGRIIAATGPQGSRDDFLFSEPKTRLNDGKWHHVVFTRNETGEKRLFVDGRLSGLSRDQGGSIINDRPIHIGGEAIHPDGQFFHGEMDELAIYTTVLSPRRVAVHYASAVYGDRLPPALERRVDFVRDVRPILRERCFECHGNETEEGGLNLSVRSRVFEGGDTVVPIRRGNSLESPLIHFVAGVDEDRAMPPDGERLTKDEIAILRAWIDQGAKWPDEVAGLDRRQQLASGHWAFQPLRPVKPPEVKSREHVRNDIDAFVLARLEQAGLKAAPPADRSTLIRRAYFDLIGLPPSPEQVEAFLADTDPQAFEKLIDELLRSKHYGERYGRHWLDVVRYADSAGYELDSFYNHAWQYRDYVIRSFNEDKPFDRFIQEQIATDELWPDRKDLRFATGFFTVGPYRYEGGIARPEVAEYQRLTDAADTLGAALLGLSVGCARCHSHKFDPISQRDYFALHALLAPAQLWDIELNKPPDNSDDRKKPQTWVLVNRDAAPLTRVLHRGELKSPGIAVAPAILSALPGGGPLDESAADSYTRRRTRLAKWLTSADNTLVARVLVNRVWKWHFGQGLVRTPNDFGTQGARPSHPQLLDYLARELVTHDWSLKHLHWLIMQSSTYRMAGQHADTSGSKTDPENRLLWHFPRRRLEAEIIWDNLLATSGQLNREQFGPPVFPPVDKALIATLRNSNWTVTKDASQWTRRGVYVVVRRSLKFPFFDTFNLNEPTTSCGRRDSTVVAPQALTMLNDQFILDQARAFAGRLVRQCGNDLEKMIRRAWLVAYARPADDKELQRSIDFLREFEETLSHRKTAKPASPTDVPADQSFPAARGAALVEFCRALFNSNEFIYVD